jgi:hypothetical protein
MKKNILIIILLMQGLMVFAQDTTDNEEYDPNAYSDASNAKKYCTQKVINQTPTKLIGVAFEQAFGFGTNYTYDTSFSAQRSYGSMSGPRIMFNYLPISTNKMILQLGLNTWSSKIGHTHAVSGVLDSTMSQVENNRADLGQFSALMFKPLNEKHFIIAQANLDAAGIGTSNNVHFSPRGITGYGSFIYGWKKGDYKMYGFGASRTYRLGRPLIVPIFLYNKTWNNKWGTEMLLPARAFLRYNVSPNNMILGGLELEGQQYAIQNTGEWLQRGEIKPRIQWEKKIYKYYWLSAQAGYRMGYRYNLVNQYDGRKVNETVMNNWGSSPYVNIGMYFVSP